MKLLRGLVGRSVRMVAGLPGRHFCCVCESRILRFLPFVPHGLRPFRQPAFIAAMQMVGSDIRNFSCPKCEAHDRERHLLLYLRASGMMQRLKGARILHLAPERNLPRVIRAETPARYVQGDLFPTGPEIERIDLQRIGYPDASFDLVIANHVMEHVADDMASLREIHRVLAIGGHAILQTPYSALLKAKFEDPGIAPDSARLEAYGQEDHVRLYGSDIFDRFASAGFANRSVTHGRLLAGFDAEEYGVNAAEPFFLFEKTAPDSDRG